MNKKETRKLKVYGQSGTDIKMPLLLFSKVNCRKSISVMVSCESGELIQCHSDLVDLSP